MYFKPSMWRVQLWPHGTLLTVIVGGNLRTSTRKTPTDKISIQPMTVILFNRDLQVTEPDSGDPTIRLPNP